MFRSRISSPESRPRSETKRAHRSRTALAAAALALPAAVGATPAVASPPNTFVDTFSYSIDFPCPQGFTLNELHQGTETIRQHNGRQMTFVHLVSQISNSVTGETIKSTTPSKYTFSGETTSIVGITMHIKGQGAGQNYIDTGRTIYNSPTGDILFDKGPSDDRPNLCVLLSE